MLGIFFLMSITIKKADVKHKEHQFAHPMKIFIDIRKNILENHRLLSTQPSVDIPANSLPSHDILDALVNAVTAARLAASMETLPPEPIRDMLGLPMQMVYSPFELRSKKRRH